MASPAEQNRDRWRLNVELADGCGESMPKAADWEIVFRFYAVVHLVDGYLRTKEARFWPDSHAKRAQSLKAAPELAKARAPYFDLKDMSEDVRYNAGYQPGAADFAKAKAWAKSVETVVAGKLERAIASLSSASVPSE
jgi:hypothetical protein